VSYQIKDIQCTCMAAPTQYEGHLLDERMFYIRYRYGTLSFKVSPEPTDDVYDAVRAEPVFREQIGEDLDGVISLTGIKDALWEKGIMLGEEQ